MDDNVAVMSEEYGVSYELQKSGPSWQYQIGEEAPEYQSRFTLHT
jgi:hypothetical protein